MQNYEMWIASVGEKKTKGMIFVIPFEYNI